MTVSSEMEKRIDETNSTAARNAWEGVSSRQPWVETDIWVLSPQGIKKGGLH
jgi:hypothetical protein